MCERRFQIIERLTETRSAGSNPQLDEPNMKIDGSCSCGENTYEAEVDPKNVVICNCTDCQSSSGGTCHVNVVVPREAFKITSGVLKRYIKTADSGKKRAIGFCGSCGTQIYAVDADGGSAYGVRVPTCKQREQLTPQVQLWCRSKPKWLAKLDEIPAREKQ
jgi:hypothetical protein